FHLTGSAKNGALDVVVGHVLVFSGEDGGAKAGIGIGVRATGTGGDHDLSNDLGESLAAARVSRGFLVLDCRPLRMSGHTECLVEETGRSLLCALAATV